MLFLRNYLPFRHQFSLRIDPRHRLSRFLLFATLLSLYNILQYLQSHWLLNHDTSATTIADNWRFAHRKHGAILYCQPLLYPLQRATLLSRRCSYYSFAILASSIDRSMPGSVPAPSPRQPKTTQAASRQETGNRESIVVIIPRYRKPHTIAYHTACLETDTGGDHALVVALPWMPRSLNSKYAMSKIAYVWGNLKGVFGRRVHYSGNQYRNLK